MKGYQSTAICKTCEGECCKTYAGSTYPADFKKPLLESLVEAFKSKKWGIDCWDWDGEKIAKNHKEFEPAYYIRPHHKKERKLFSRSWGGVCIFLSSKGCKLSFRDRPTECRMLEPKKNGSFKCVTHCTSKLDAAKAWLKYTETIKQTAKECGVVL